MSSSKFLGEQFGDRRFVAALGEFITRHGRGVVIPRAKEARSGLVFDIARKQQTMSFGVFSREGSFWLGLVRGMGARHVSLGAVSWASVWEQNWSLFECFAEPLEFACVESEGSVVLLVHLTILGPTPIVFTSYLEYVALSSSVGCVGTFLVSVVSGRSRLPLNLLRLPGFSSRTSRSLPLANPYPTATCGCFEHSTCGSLVWVM